MLLERMAILNAIYFPDAAYERRYEDITPVNAFGVALNQYLNADLGLLEDKTFYSGYADSYSFVDVTELTSEWAQCSQAPILRTATTHTARRSPS